MVLLRHNDNLIAGAFGKARWMCKDALSRRGAMAAAELLLAHAAELAGSADGRDQLLSLGLSAGAADIVAGRRPLDAAPSVTLVRGAGARGERLRFAYQARETECAAMRLADGIADEIARLGLAPASARRLLLDCAALQASLWGAPEIPADSAARAVMRLSAPAIRERAKRRGGLLASLC